MLSRGGTGPSGSFLDIDPPARYGPPHLPKNSTSSIIFVTGVLDRSENPSMEQKEAVSAGFQALAIRFSEELKPIRVNCISPYKTD